MFKTTVWGEWNKRKPCIKFIAGGWRCVSSMVTTQAFLTIVGYGQTPTEAYQAWLNKR